MSKFFPVIVPATVVGKIYLLFEDFAVKAIPVGSQVGVVVGRVDEHGAYRPNTAEIFSSKIISASQRLFEKAFKQLSAEQLAALKIIPESVIEQITQQKAEAEKQKAEQKALKAKQPKVLTAEEIAKQEKKRAESAKRRAEAEAAEAQALRDRLQPTVATTPKIVIDEVEAPAPAVSSTNGKGKKKELAAASN